MRKIKTAGGQVVQRQVVPAEGYVRIAYAGGTVRHWVASPTGALKKKTNSSFYKLGKKGDVFNVLKEDQEARPDLFVLLPEPAPTKRRRTATRKAPVEPAVAAPVQVTEQPSAVTPKASAPKKVRKPRKKAAETPKKAD